MHLTPHFLRPINFNTKIYSSYNLITICFIYWCILKYIKNYPDIQHIAFISATYYKNSTIYPPNIVVILFNSQKHLYFDNRLVCETWTTSDSIKRKNNSLHKPPSTYLSEKRIKDLAHIRPAFSPIPICEWTTFIAVCKAAENSNQLSLTNTKISSSSVNVPLRHAYTNKHDVISCFSPFFYNERWQLLITSLEIFRQFGVNLQIYYIQSIRKELYDLMKVYENLGHVAIETWGLIDLGFANKKSKDPNKELDWRNQAAAHTDCFLKYREAADFIIISDTDDILFPKMGKSYIQEFRNLALQNLNAAGFTYNRYNIEIASSKSASDFSFLNLLNFIQITNEWENGKSVVIPSKVETAWIHYPSIIISGYHMVTVPEETNIMVHFKYWTLINSSFANDNDTQTSFKEFYDPQMSDIIQSDKIHSFSKNANNFMKENAENEFKALPSDIFYFPLIEKCYGEIHNSIKENVNECPGPVRCKLPKFVPGFSCVIAKRKYTHHRISKNLNVHYSSTENEFELSLNGCRM